MRKRKIQIFFLLVLLSLPKFVFAAGKLLQQSDLTFLGAFKVPQGAINGSSFNYGGREIAFRQPSGSNGPNGSLFMVGHTIEEKVGELQIPSLVSSSNLADLNAASLLQTLTDPTQGNLSAINTIARTAITGGRGCSDIDLPARSAAGGPCGEDILIGGLLVYNNKLIGTSFDYYDGGTPTFGYYSHFTSSLNLSSPNFSGMYRANAAMTDGNDVGRFVAGAMTKIPSEWQSALGGTALTGLSTVPIISKTSYGPDAFAFNPDDLIDINTPFPATPLLYYNQQHQNLGGYITTNGVYNATALFRNIVFPNGTDSVLFFGTIGTGTYCYGNGSADISYTNTPGCVDGIGHWDADASSCIGGPDPTALCYDPDAGGGKGPHAWPYTYKIWAYDAKELAEVKTGSKNPWDLQPYAVWDMKSKLPFAVPSTGVGSGMENYGIGGATYDPATKRLYVVQSYGDGSYPVVNVFLVNTGSDAISPAAPSGLNVQ